MKMQLTESGLAAVKEHGRTGWETTDAVILHGCPKCGAPEWDHCVSPSGGKKWPPHRERRLLLVEKPNSCNRITGGIGGQG